MMNYLPLFMKLSKNLITDCYEHQWESYNKAQVLCFEDEPDGASSFYLSLAYRPSDMEYVSLEVKDTRKDIQYVLLNPKFADSILGDYKYYDIDFDNIVFLEEVDDFAEKASAIIAGKPYDSNILIKLDLPKPDIESLTRQAEKLGKSLHDYLVEVIVNDVHKTLNERPVRAPIVDDGIRIV